MCLWIISINVRTRSLRHEADIYVQHCLRHGTPPHVNELASRLGLSASQLSRKFRQEAGLRASTHLKNARMMCARQLLAQTALPLEEIARRCGFGTVTSFHRWFLRVTGITPGEYRKSLK